MGWIIDTMANIIALPEHRVQRLAEILASIPRSQNIIGVTKWHKVLDEVRYMALSLPGAQNIFGHMQIAMSNKNVTRIALKKGVHQYLTDFKWLLENLSKRPTHIAKLIPLRPQPWGTTMRRKLVMVEYVSLQTNAFPL